MQKLSQSERASLFLCGQEHREKSNKIGVVQATQMIEGMEERE